MWSGTPTPVQNFITIRSGFFCYVRVYKVARLVNFGGFFLFSSTKTPTSIFTINTLNDVSRKEVPFGVSKTKFYIDFIPPKTGNLGANFDWT